MKLTHTHTPVHQHQPLSWAHIKVNTHFIQCHTSLQQNTKTSVLLQYTYISMCYHSNKSNSWWTTEIAIRGWKAGDTDVQGETGMLGSICPPSSVSVSGINWPFHNQVIVEGTIYIRLEFLPPKAAKTNCIVLLVSGTRQELLLVSILPADIVCGNRNGDAQLVWVQWKDKYKHKLTALMWRAFQLQQEKVVLLQNRNKMVSASQNSV